MSGDSSSSEDDFEAVDDKPTSTSANAAKTDEFEDDDDIFSDVFSTSENVSKLETIIKPRKVPEKEKGDDDNMTSKVIKNFIFFLTTQRFVCPTIIVLSQVRIMSVDSKHIILTKKYSFAQNLHSFFFHKSQKYQQLRHIW